MLQSLNISIECGKSYLLIFNCFQHIFGIMVFGSPITTLYWGILWAGHHHTFWISYKQTPNLSRKVKLKMFVLNATMNLNENTSTTSTIFKLVLSTGLQFPSKFKFSGFDVELQLLFLFRLLKSI